MKIAESDEELKAIHEQLIGRLSAAGQIDTAFKQCAKSLVMRRSINRNLH